MTSALGLWYAIKEQAKRSASAALNWSVRTGSTGSVYSVAGDPITSLGALGNGAWWVWQGHGLLDNGTVYRREICIQVNGSGQARVKYSPRAGFVGGSPSPTQVPSATDERVLLGSGTDGSPTYATLWPGSGAWAQARFSESTDDMLIFTYNVGGSLPTACFWLETTPPVYDVATLVDKDPALLHVMNGSTCLTDALGDDETAPRGLLAATKPEELWARLPVGFRMSRSSGGSWTRIFPGGLPQDPAYAPITYSQERPRFARNASRAGTLNSGEAGNSNTSGDKGRGTTCHLSGTTFSSPTAIDSRDSASGSLRPKSVLGLGYLLVPWEGAYQPAI